MAIIILKDSFLLEGDKGKQLAVIACDHFQKSYTIDGIEAFIEGKKVTIPIRNITAIVE